MPADRSDSRRADPLGIAAGAPSLPIRCPQCGAAGLVNWTSLQNGIRCPQCDCEFVVAKGGNVVRLADMPHVRFACPRCHKSGRLPAPLAARRAKCPGCGLALARGPDQQLHGVAEAAEKRKAAPPGPRRPWRDRPMARLLMTADGRLRRGAAVALAAVAITITVVGVAAAAVYFNPSAETLAQRLVASCLDGGKDAGLEFVADDAVQLVELERWRKRHFTSIVDRHRPDGDRVRIVAVSLPDAGPHRVLAVTLRSPFLGSRNLIQYWRIDDGQWNFDARATLASEDGPLAIPRSRAHVTR
jgi:hypothetical protein